MHRLTRTVLAAALVATALPLGPPALAATAGGTGLPAAPAVVSYGPDNDQTYDVREPDAGPGSDPNTGRPWVLLVHGGSWAAGSKASTAATAAKLTAAGYVTFNAAYRLSSDYGSNVGAPWPAQRVDVLAALDDVRANAERYGIDPDRGALYGFSAGGHIAASAGLYGAGAERVRAVVSVAGVLQPHRVSDVANAYPAAHGGDVATSPMRTLAGWEAVLFRCPRLTTWTECNSRWNDGLPERHAGPGDPPVWMVQGDADPSVPRQTLPAFDYWLTRAGVPHVTTLVPGASHDERALLTGDTADAQARWSSMLTWLQAQTAASSGGSTGGAS